MGVLLAVVFLLLGMAFLEIGADLAVAGARDLAAAARVSAFAVGAILFGIDTESLGSTVVAAGQGHTSFALGIGLGTIVFTFGVAFAVALFLARRPVSAPSPGSVLAPGIGLVGLSLAVNDLVITRPEGLALVLLYVAYVSYVVVEARAERVTLEPGEGDDPGPRGRLGWPLAKAALGLVVLYGGAWLMVEGGVRVLERTDLAAGFVGAALVGVLVSLDEVVLEVMAVRRGSDALATGNLFGTLAAFTTVAPGIAALVRPLVVDGAVSATLIAAGALYALVATVLLIRGRARRALGIALAATFVAWAVVAARL